MPAAVEIFFQLDWIDLLTRFLGLRRLRRVTVLVFARLVLRLANEYYDNKMNLCVQKKNNGLIFSCTACTRSNFQDSHSHQAC